MKKQLIVSVGLAVLSTSAFATKARMQALGENINDNIGSLYFSDSRNMFQNAAYINEYKDMIIMEWGSSANTSGNAGQAGTAFSTTAKNDNDKSPQAEGGFTKSIGSNVFGLYLGAESPYTNEIRSYSRSLANEAFHQDNQIDAFFGGEGSFKWGVNATYSKSNEKSLNAKQDSASIRFGGIWEKVEAFANVALSNKAETQSVSLAGAPPTTYNQAAGKDKFKGKLGFELGSTYKLEHFKVFGYVRHAAWEHEGNSALNTNATAYVGKFDGTYWLYQVGAGREHKITDKTTLFTKLEFLKFNRKVEGTSGALDNQTVKLNDWRAPITFGIEHDASSWLTLRGSVVQNIVGEEDNDYNATQAASLSSGVKAKRAAGKRTLANSTAVNAGATLKFGNLSIDGVIGAGNNGTNGNLAQTSQGLNQKSDQKGVLSLDNLMTRVAMTYRF